MEVVRGLRALDTPRVVADQRPLVEFGALGTEERPTSTALGAQMVNLELISKREDNKNICI